MAVGILETNGLSDRAVYSQVMTNLKGAYSKYGVGDGNYPKAGDMLTDRILDNIWMKNILDAKIFIDGQGITSRTGGNNCSSIRIPLMAPPRWSMRTLTIGQCVNGVLQGTPNNDGLENRNLPNVPQSNGVDLNLNQLYDDATIIYQLSQDMVSLPIAAEYTAQIPSTVANMEDTTILATHIMGGLVRGAETENSNLIDVDLTEISEGYFQGIMNKLIGCMRNPQTSWSEGVVQYDLKNSIIVMKESFWDLIFSVKNGALVNASNIAQSMFLGGAFTEDGKPLGNANWGMYSGVIIKVVPDSYWRQAAAISGIPAEKYADYDKVQAYIANAIGFGFGRASAQINPIPNPGNAIGTKIQTLMRWGTAIIRPSACGVIVAGLTGFTNPFDKNGNIVVPENINETIKSYGIGNVDYGDTTKIGVSEDAVEEGSYNHSTKLFTKGGVSYKFGVEGNHVEVTGTVPYATADSTAGLEAGNRICARISNPLVSGTAQLPTGNIVETLRANGTTQKYTKTAFENDGSLVYMFNANEFTTAGKTPTVKVTWADGIVYTYTFDLSKATLNANS